MSLGGTGHPVESCATTADPEHKAICNATAAGVHFVVAAGNSGWDFDYAPEPDTPAAYPEVLSTSEGAGGPRASCGSSPHARAADLRPKTVFEEEVSYSSRHRNPATAARRLGLDEARASVCANVNARRSRPSAHQRLMSPLP